MMLHKRAAKCHRVTEQGLYTILRKSQQPVLVCYRSPDCQASEALIAMLDSLAAEYAERIVFLTFNIENSVTHAELHQISGTPTLVLYRWNEEQSRLLGYLPERLLRVFLDAICDPQAEIARWWSPIEQIYEDTVILPLLDAWGWRAERQVSCRIAQGRSVRKGRIDVLAYQHQTPITLFEAKRLILHPQALEQASQQAHSYAHALGLNSYVVAAPSGMWLYRVGRSQSQLVTQISSLELDREPKQLHDYILQINAQAMP